MEYQLIVFRLGKCFRQTSFLVFLHNFLTGTTWGSWCLSRCTESVGVIKNELDYDNAKLDKFAETIAAMRSKGTWNRGELIDLFNWMMPNFDHKETGKFFDGRM